MEGGLSIPIVAGVHVPEILRVFAGVEMYVEFGAAADEVPASFHLRPLTSALNPSDLSAGRPATRPHPGAADS